METVDEVGTTGRHTSLAIGAGEVHIAYIDNRNPDLGEEKELRYAHRSIPDGVDNDCDGVPW